MTSNNKARPIVLNFSGSDNSGMAGIAMDMRVQQAFKVHSVNVITANTAQNSQELISLNPISNAVFEEQLVALKSLDIKAIKVGLLSNSFQMQAIADYAKKTELPLIIDPVMGSTSKHKFWGEEEHNTFIEKLLPQCDLLTPNIPEAEALTGIKIKSSDDVQLAAKKLVKMGAGAVVIKGGHSPNLSKDLNKDSNLVQDYFYNLDKSFWLSSAKINTANTRGTGCAFASALAASAALTYSIYDAAVIAKMAINQGLRQSYSVDSSGPISITHFPDAQSDLPTLSIHANIKANEERDAFPGIFPKLGLYPVVDRAEWIEKLAPAGISVIQLRIKDLHGQALEDEIQKGVILAAKHSCRLFINDYWQLAIKYQAHGVHLGQEDLDDADIDHIHASGLRLGTSTHCHYEVARAHLYKPSYIACGPVYHTNTKDMPWVPHGIDGLSYWQNVLDYPLIAIGGINAERIPAVAQTGVSSIAMITAITLADDPLATTQHFIELMKTNKKPTK